jgi:hypothetical protein
MSTSYELGPMIATVAGHLRPSLVSRDNIANILSIARGVPSWQCAGFECRLGDPAPRADFGIHLRRQHGIPGDALRQDGLATAASATSPAWQRLRRFADAWSDRDTLVAQAIPAVSLEFDVHDRDGQSEGAAPSIFVSMRFGPRSAARARTRSVDDCRVVVDAVLDALGADAGGARDTLDRSVRVVMSRVAFLQLGVWLARPVDTFRICAPGLPLRDIPAVVRALGWSGPADAYASRWKDLLEFGDRGTLHLDVGRGIAPRVGIEVIFGERSATWQRDDPEDTRVLDYLVEKGLCLPEKRDAVLSWVGAFRLGGLHGEDGSALFLRTVSHVKLVFEPDQPPQAKAYLAVGRVDRRTAH